MAMLLLVAVGCAEDATPEPRGVLVDPPAVDGKVDVANAVELRGDLAIDAEEGAREASAVMERDLEFHGYTVELRAGALVDLEVTQRGSSRSMDSTLYVYGPRDAERGFGSTALAFDDDAGWGRLSRLRGVSAEQAGTYLIVVGTHDGRGRGSYRLLASCASDDRCGPEAPAPPGDDARCDARLLDAVEACVADWQGDPDYDPSQASTLELIEACADIEPLAPVWDELCAGGAGAALACDDGIEAFADEVVPGCRLAARSREYDRSCVFGATYRDAWRDPAALVVGATRALRAGDELSSLEREQVVRAVRETAYSEVSTFEEAISSVDGQVANWTPLWDASARRAFVVVEVGAGDNSFGAYFPADGAEPVATIGDGDVYGCEVTWGPERRECAGAEECGEGLQCMRGEYGPGRCVDPSLDDHPDLGADCDSEAPCPFDEGLVCAGGTAGAGLCGPAWMRGRFYSEPAQLIPDGGRDGAEATLLVTGLASVSTDVELDLLISHPRPSDLVATLTNPSGTEVVVFDGSGSGSEVWLEGVPVFGFPGDESANGIWRLRVVDSRRGQAGVIGRFGLTVTSRWD